MNNKGQVVLVALMIATVIIVFALAVAGPTKQFTDEARNNLQLNCSFSNLTKTEDATCVAIDYMLPLFIGALIAIGGAIAVAKIIA